ncbi:hypothetical protein NHQ30_008893 [Ciborinia camelliae]|nr:hypothetical protein NHQ30_008893 [Ciborinia camelliae]
MNTDQLLFQDEFSREMAITTIQNLALSIATLKYVPALTFHGFRKLPLEIRLKIWRKSFEQRKVNLREEVMVRSSTTKNPITFNNRDVRIYRYLPCPVGQAAGGNKNLPTTALINRESRNETLRHYIRLHQNLWRPFTAGPSLPNTIYLNPDIDTVYLVSYFYPKVWFSNPLEYLDTLFPPYDPVAMSYMDKIRCLEIYVVKHEIRIADLLYRETETFMALLRFANLEQIVLVLPRNTAPWIHTETIAQMEDVFTLEKRSEWVQWDYAKYRMPKITSREDDCIAQFVPKGVQLPGWYNMPGENIRKFIEENFDGHNFLRATIIAGRHRMRPQHAQEAVVTRAQIEEARGRQ